MQTRCGRALACWIVSLGLVISACSDSERKQGPRASATAGPTAAETTLPGTSPSPGVTSPAPIFEPEDRVLNIAISEPSTLDPMRIQDPGSVLVARQLYEGLTRWNPRLEKVVPAAAEGWRAADGGRTFVFRLRQGMTFHDGTPVTSDSFRFAFDRIALKRNASDLAYTLEPIAGFAQVNQQGSAAHLAGITTPDKSTLVIRLSEPFQDFPAVLTHPGLVPLPPGAVRDLDRFLSVPVGNGPFRIAEQWAPGQPVILEAFPGFIETPDLDGIRFLPFGDASASWLRFLAGELHVAEVPAGQVEAAQEKFGEDGFRPLLAGYSYGLNLRSKQLRNLKLRRAVSRAINRRAIVSSIYKGTMVEPRGIVPVGMPGFQENICIDLCRYSPELARRLVRSIPRKSRNLTLEYTKGEPHGQVAALMKKDLTRAGLRVRTRGYAFPQYLRRLRDGRQSAYRLGWIAEYPVADVFLTPLFRSDSPDNHSGFKSRRVDSLLREAHAEPSPARRLQLYIEAEKAILRQVPIVPVGSFVTHWAAQPEVDGIEFDTMGGFDAVGISLNE